MRNRTLLLAVLIGIWSVTHAEDTQVESLVENLGAREFRVREAAEAKLKTFGREVLPLLAKQADAADPEIHLRVGRVIDVIKRNPALILQSYFAVAAEASRGDWPQQTKRWKAAFEDLEKRSRTCVSHTNGRSGGGLTLFAQSFVPGCGKVCGVALSAYPVGDGNPGWLKLELREDAGGQPSEYVLSRSWLRFEKNCPVTHGAFVLFALPETDVVLTGTYWIQFEEVPDQAEVMMTNVGQSEDYAYKQGVCLGCGNGFAAKFMILSEPGDFPLLRPATDGERAALIASPKHAAQTKIKRER